MRIISFNDVHATGRSPRSRKDIFPNTIKNKLIEIGDISNEVGADIIICSGDLFHTPIVALNYAREIASIIRDWKKTFYVVPGNHDCLGYSMDTLNNTILGMLEATGVITLLTSKSPIGFLIEGKSISIEGREYSIDIDKDPSVYNKQVKADYNILVAHGMLQPTSILESINHILVEDITNPANLTIVGHYHNGWGAVRNDNNIFINIGSIGRTDKGDKHFPMVLQIDLDVVNDEVDMHLSTIPLQSAKPHSEVFDLSVDTLQQQKESFVEFINSIQSSNIADQKDANEYITSLVNDNEIESEVKNICDKYLEAARHTVNNSNITHYTKSKENIYIKELYMKNFLAHKESKLEFIDGFNVIVGQNNAGKSSIFDCIQWVLYDIPKGRDYFRTGASVCEAKIVFSNGHWIKKKKTKTTSEYQVYDGVLVHTFEGFGSGLPIEITNCHQMPLVNLFRDKPISLNYASQLDGLFLVGNSPSEKAEALGKLTGADIIDEAIKSVATDLRKQSSMHDSLLQEKDNLENEIKNLDEEVLYLHIKHNKALELDSTIKLLNVLKDKCNFIKTKKQEELQHNAELENTKKNMSSIKPLVTSIDKSANIVSAIVSIINNLNDINKETDKKKHLEKKINAINNIDLKINTFSTTKILDLLVSKKELEKLKYQLDNLELSNKVLKDLIKETNYATILHTLFEFQDVSSHLNDYNIEVIENHMRFLEVSREINNIDAQIQELQKEVEHSICPTCNRELDAESAEFVINNIKSED